METTYTTARFTLPAAIIGVPCILPHDQESSASRSWWEWPCSMDGRQHLSKNAELVNKERKRYIIYVNELPEHSTELVNKEKVNEAISKWMVEKRNGKKKRE